MINLSNEQINYILAKNVGDIVIDGKRYYFKTVDYNQRFNELIGMRVADSLGINCVSYELFTVNQNSFYLSDALDNYGKFVLGKTIFDEYLPSDMSVARSNFSLYEMWSSLQHRYGDNGIFVVDLVKTYLMDIFMLNVDRHKQNWGILEKTDGNELYILDNSSILVRNVLDLSSFFNDRDAFYAYEKGNNQKFGNILGTNMTDLEYFLKTSSEEFQRMFLEFYDKLSPDNFEKILKEIEMENNDSIPFKDKMLSLYQENYSAIT